MRGVFAVSRFADASGHVEHRRHARRKKSRCLLARWLVHLLEPRWPTPRLVRGEPALLVLPTPEHDLRRTPNEVFLDTLFHGARVHLERSVDRIDRTADVFTRVRIAHHE